MSLKRIRNNIQFKPGDVEAILCALPLVSLAQADTIQQTQLNQLNCKTASEKLMANVHTYTANELRVMAVAIGFALDILRGTGNEIISTSDVDPDWKAELSKNLFVYTCLQPLFDDLITRIESNR